jgi:integrase/recombinase XerD
MGTGGLTKQAKILSTQQINKMLDHLSLTRYPTRNRLIFLLSCKAGLRSKEISELKWGMITDPEGNLSHSIHLPNNASKGKSGGRVIPMHPSLWEELKLLKDEQERTDQDHHIIQTAQNSHPTAATITQMFQTWYKGSYPT